MQCFVGDVNFQRARYRLSEVYWVKIPNQLKLDLVLLVTSTRSRHIPKLLTVGSANSSPQQALSVCWYF
jgi:hypothetical protein